MNNPEVKIEDNEIKYKDIQVCIESDLMSATVRLHTPATGSEYMYSEVMDALSGAGVKMGIDNDIIHNIIENHVYDKDVIVAHGKPVENGTDGHFIFNFQTRLDKKPVVKEDGTVDYYNVKKFEITQKGDKLAEYVPPTSGVFGYNVCGSLLTPKPGKPKSRLRGRGFDVSEDGNIYTAACNGKIQYCNNELNIINILEIRGNVDVSVGNIEFNGDVKISGNVLNGVRIDAKGSIFIGGRVEDATIISGCDVIINNGVNAKTRGKITAKENICAKFLENAELNAGQDIKTGYILNCTAEAGGKVLIQNIKGGIYGGNITGVMGVESNQIGSESFVNTVITVGLTKNLKNQYSKVLLKLRDINSEIEIFANTIDKYNRLKKVNPEKFDPQLYKKIFQSKIIKTAEKVKYEEEMKKLYEDIRESVKSEVKIRKNLYPGVKIIIEDQVFKPMDTMSHLIVRKFNDKIVVKEYQ